MHIFYIVRCASTLNLRIVVIGETGIGELGWFQITKRYSFFGPFHTLKIKTRFNIENKLPTFVSKYLDFHSFVHIFIFSNCLRTFPYRIVPYLVTPMPR